ncbi:hypothetical protein ACGFX4_07145 [Kitasatospora sp. NPDC048365]|uniref:hypothetical protein n=1 Tax=Kitasatospora sp. NPDC048365 TaxID=3364050 RepID=UPI0037217718
MLRSPESARVGRHRDFHDRVAACSPIDVADGLGAEVRRLRLPSGGLRRVGRELVEHGTQRAVVKIGLVLLGLGGDTRDRELLLLLGTLDELTLYAAVALHRSQPDGDRAVHALAQRVAGWGRIQAVRTLRDTTDPAVKAWLLREGFRNTVMDEYLAHIAATTGDLHRALSGPEIDAALMDGAGGILAALAASHGGPAPGLADYPDAVPVLRRYADLVHVRTPSLGLLRDLITVTVFFRHPPQDLPWTPADVRHLTARFEALLREPRWPALVLDHLADPHRPDFHLALGPAQVLGLHPTAQVMARVETAPSLLDPTWMYALRIGEAGQAGHVLALAEQRLASTPHPERDHALLLLAHHLRAHPAKAAEHLRSTRTLQQDNPQETQP